MILFLRQYHESSFFNFSNFFLLGLKLSSKIDFGKRVNPVNSIISTKIFQRKAPKAIHLFSSPEPAEKADTLKTEDRPSQGKRTK